jgi:hypothetical protein
MKKSTRQKCSGVDTLLNTIINEQGLANDSALANFLETNRPVISKLRTASRNRGVYGGAQYGLSGDMIIAIHERTGMPIARIKALAAGQA